LHYRVEFLAICVAFGAASPGFSQTLAPVNVNTAQNLLGLAVGNGVTRGAAVVLVNPSATPLIGVGALSGKADHFGSLVSASLLNNVCESACNFDPLNGSGSASSL
jgi:hypothetical protein